MKSVLITGANGFIGRHLLQVFLSNGHKVYAGVRTKSDVRHIESLDVEILRLDYLNPKVLKEQVSKLDLSIVVHNAGVTVAKNREGYFLGNTKTTANLLEALIHGRLEKFIYMSSLAAHGPGKNRGDSPISYYGQSKLKAEGLVREAGIPFAIVRPSAVYGPGDAAFTPVFSWAQKGIFLQLGSPERGMTFVHVADLAEMVFACVDSKRDIIYGWDGVNYAQRDLTNALKLASNHSGIVLTIPSWLFQIGTSLIDLFVRRLFKRLWAYPPMKVVELIADDWSISEEEKPEKIQYLIEKGFVQTFNTWLTERK